MQAEKYAIEHTQACWDSHDFISHTWLLYDPILKDVSVLRAISTHCSHSPCFCCLHVPYRIAAVSAVNKRRNTLECTKHKGNKEALFTAAGSQIRGFFFFFFSLMISGI